jgi:hypothetical protein
MTLAGMNMPGIYLPGTYFPGMGPPSLVSVGSRNCRFDKLRLKELWPGQSELVALSRRGWWARDWPPFLTLELKV